MLATPEGPEVTTSHQEPLEPRRLFATLLFEGTAADDVMELDVEKGAIILTLNGAPTFHADDSFDVIDVRGLGGDDAIAVFNSGDNDVLVRGDFADGSGDGDDTIDVGAGNLDAVNTTIEITAGGGSDVARLNDQNNNFSDAFTVNSTRASRPFFFGTTYG